METKWEQDTLATNWDDIPCGRESSRYAYRSGGILKLAQLYLKGEPLCGCLSSDAQRVRYEILVEWLDESQRLEAERNAKEKEETEIATSVKNTKEMRPAESSTITLTLTMQNAIILISEILGIKEITVDTMDSACPPCYQAQHMSLKQLKQVQACGLVSKHINFETEDLHSIKGGPEFNLLKVQQGPPRLVVYQVEAKGPNKIFVYDPEDHCSMKDQKNVMKCSIMPADRVCKNKSRECLNSFFKSKVRIRFVYCCTAKQIV